MKKIGIIGHFGKDKGQISGQIIKTENLYSALTKYTDFDVAIVDTYGWKKHPFKLYKAIKKAFAECDVIIMLPAHNGVKIFAPLLVKFKKKYGKKIYYDVIGGWLSDMISDKKKLAKSLKAFDGIWVETTFLKQSLENEGFDNVEIIPNFKDIEPILMEKLCAYEDYPLRLCTFSRISRMKGIEDAVDAVINVNERMGYNAYKLDIYGAVENGEEVWFEALKQKLSDGVCTYKGAAEGDRSTEILKDYFALVFPTRYKTEGVPGTIIDAYCAALPVISAKWQSFDDCIDDGKSGIGYEILNTKELENVLFDVAKNPKKIINMKEYCVQKAQVYASKEQIKTIEKLILKD